MKRPSEALLVMLLAVCLVPRNQALAQSNQPAAGERSVLFLTRANNGQRIPATVGQTIQADLEMLGSAEVDYQNPQISSPSVRYENWALKMPANPGGAIPILIFKAVSAGEAEIRISRGAAPFFAVTIDVQTAEEEAVGRLQLDQAYTDDSRAGSTNLVNLAVQTFTPSLPKLVKVEVELVDINDTPDHAVTVTLLNTDGQPMAIAEKALMAGDPGWVSFLFANGGVDVTPGEVYGMQISGGNRFGWKYTEGGYRKGEALFNGKPILKGAHASFMFKTFGSKSEAAAPLEPRP